MISSQHLELIYIFKYLFLAGLYAASLPNSESAGFSISSLFDATMSMIHPVVAAGSNRCEAFKSFFGLTYEQMQEKNKTNLHEVLNIDLITRNGNIKYNLTATKRMNRLMAHAQTIVILIHGFMESSDGWMVHAIAPELLKKPELKVFALDGRKIINLEYFRSSTYVRFMGEMLGTFLGESVKNGQDPSKIYIIGHSLGCHIAGVAGKKVNELTGKLLGRITALDPAGPCFSNISANGRLDKTDAVYVDVIHSNAGILGLKEPATKIFIPMEVFHNQDAIFPYVITAELGSCSPNLLVHLNIFQLEDAITGRCLEKVSAQVIKYPTWGWNLTMKIQAYTFLAQKNLPLLGCVLQSLLVPQLVAEKVKNVMQELPDAQTLIEMNILTIR